MCIIRKIFVFILTIHLNLTGYSQSINKFLSNSDSIIVVFSPGAMLMGRANLRFESKISDKKSIGFRLENLFIDNIFDRHLWVLPYVRVYPLTKALRGFYIEADIFARWRYQYSSGWKPEYVDWYKSSYGLRFYVGSQTFEGVKKNTPFDISLGFNLDRRALIYNGDVSLGTGAVAPMSVLNIRVQAGILLILTEK